MKNNSLPDLAEPKREPGTFRNAEPLLANHDGQDLVEYALLVSVVALGAVVALNNFQNVVGNVWGLVANSLSSGN